MQNKIRFPKVLNPNLISKKEQKEVKKLVREALKGFSIEKAMELVRIKHRKAGHYHGHQHH